MSEDESKGLRYAGLGLLAVFVLFAFLTIPSGAPLRNPETGALVGDSPFMNGLIVAITIVFFVTGLAYGVGAKTIKSSLDVVNSMTKAIESLGGLLVLLFIISQFLALFTYSNIAILAAIKMGDILARSGFGALPLLIGFVVVVAVLGYIMTGSIPKWAIFAPVFIPMLMRLGVEPEAVLAAYRVADSPVNAITPLNAYFALIVVFAQRYQKDAGVGTILAMMLPYVIVLYLVWTALLAAWYLLGIPWGF
jgi:aminobenzoyl-glutamate transport protein